MDESVSKRRAPVAAAVALALAVTLFLSWLTYLREPSSGPPVWIAWLPGVAASANACAAVTLAFGFVMVRRRQLDAHRNAMLTAVGFSAIFFVAYVTRHYFHGDTPFDGTGIVRFLYLSMLVTHILGSVVVLILLPLSIRFAVLRQFGSHKRINHWLLPIWFYVSVTGVAIYFALR